MMIFLFLLIFLVLLDLSSGLIYTYIGDILIAVNPFKSMAIYDDSVS